MTQSKLGEEGLEQLGIIVSEVMLTSFRFTRFPFMRFLVPPDAMCGLFSTGISGLTSGVDPLSFFRLSDGDRGSWSQGGSIDAGIGRL